MTGTGSCYMIGRFFETKKEQLQIFKGSHFGSGAMMQFTKLRKCDALKLTLLERCIG